MAPWHKLADVNDLPSGGAREFTISGRIVALFHVGDVFHAIDGICPHSGGPLAEGTIVDAVVTCPWHGWQFDVASGCHLLNPRIKQAQFAVKIEHGAVWVQIPEPDGAAAAGLAP